MNVWQPPFRICAYKNDKILVQALNSAVENQPQWEVVYGETVWECALYCMNAGAHVVFMPDTVAQEDMHYKLFDELRYLVCRKLPLPYLFVKVGTESDDGVPISLGKKITPIGIINQIKTELFGLYQELHNKGTAWVRYLEFQFSSFVQLQLEDPGFLLTNVVPAYSLAHAQIWPFVAKAQYAEAQKILETAQKSSVGKSVLQATWGLFYYQQNKPQEARAFFNEFVNIHQTQPLLLYIVFLFIDSFRDYGVQCALLQELSQRYPTSYPTLLISGLWNSRMNNFDLGITQLLGCLEFMPADLFVGNILSRLLKRKNFTAMGTGIENYVLSSMLKTNVYQQIFNNLLGIRTAS